MEQFINVGFGNRVASSRIISFISYDSAPSKRMVQEKKEQKRCIDATQGRKTRTIVLLENDQIVLSAIQPETIALRLNGKAEEKENGA